MANAEKGNVERRAFINAFGAMTVAGLFCPAARAQNCSGVSVFTETDTLVELQFPIEQARSLFELVLGHNLQVPEIPAPVRQGILNAFDQVLAAAEQLSTCAMVEALFNMKNVLDQSGLPAVQSRFISAVTSAVICLFVCGITPKKPPPGTFLWLLLGWIPGDFDGTRLCVWACV
jgi:hypothetical protein